MVKLRVRVLRKERRVLTGRGEDGEVEEDEMVDGINEEVPVVRAAMVEEEEVGRDWNRFACRGAVVDNEENEARKIQTRTRREAELWWPGDDDVEGASWRTSGAVVVDG
ncbi:uncharacterized protein A4U43_C08F26460 [Asparagus officinalis]|nr:uncharacterized protein A4U43_C08F26460 [Asparagus officinalis]